MKLTRLALVFPVVTIVSLYILAGLTGCANIIPPGGGPRDTLAPVLISAIPKDSATNFTGNKITLNFDEYVDIQNAFENLLVSPLPNNVPVVNYNFRTVTVKIKDTLEPNTTYSINFGNAIRDINEGNVLKNFTYVFSTGNMIDTNSLSGRVVMAETGKVDSTLIVVLHRSLADTAVTKDRPRYLARLNGNGNFTFNNVAAGKYAVYALPNDYSKKYEDTTKPFAFADSPLVTNGNRTATLYAYQNRRADTVRKQRFIANMAKDQKDKPLRVTSALGAGRQDLLKDLEFGFTKRIATFDSTGIRLTDTNFNPIAGYTVKGDTVTNIFTIINNWPPNTAYNLIIDKGAFTDTAGGQMLKNDTARFFTKSIEDYGALRLRFNNLDVAKNPVLQIVSNNVIVDSIPLTQREVVRKLFQPGDYELRILFDKNKNGTWDPGHFFGKHGQPEIVNTLPDRLSVRANWDNEKDINL